MRFNSSKETLLSDNRATILNPVSKRNFYLSGLSMSVLQFALDVPLALPFHVLFFPFPFLLFLFSSFHSLIVPLKGISIALLEINK